MAGGSRKGKAKQNTKKRRRKNLTSNSVSGDSTKNASEVDSPVPQKKLLLDETLRCDNSGLVNLNQVNENSQLGSNLQLESSKYVPPFSSRESIASAGSDVNSQQNSLGKKETRPSRKIKINRSLSRPAKTKPKETCSNVPFEERSKEKEEVSKTACKVQNQKQTSLQGNNLEVVESSEKYVFSSGGGQKNEISGSQYNKVEIITEFLNEVLQSVEETCSNVKSSEGKQQGKEFPKEVTFVKEAQMERKASVKTNIKLKRETKTLKKGKSENKIVKIKKEEPLGTEIVDEESGSKLLSLKKRFPQSTNNVVSLEEIDCVPAINSASSNAVTDSDSIRKVEEWLQSSHQNEGTEEQGHGNATANMSIKSSDVVELTLNGGSKQGLSNSQKVKQENCNNKTATIDVENTNSDASLQLSTDKIISTLSGEERCNFSADDLKTVSEVVNELCKSVENYESQSDLNQFATSVCQSGEVAAMDFQTDEQLRETLRVLQNVVQGEKSSSGCHSNPDFKASAFHNQVFAGKPSSSHEECDLVTSRDTCHIVETLSSCTDICNCTPDLCHSRETQDHALEGIKQENLLDTTIAVNIEPYQEKDTQPQYIDIVNSFCTLHDEGNSVNELTAKNTANSLLQTVTCCCLDKNKNSSIKSCNEEWNTSVYHLTCYPADNKPAEEEIENRDSTFKLHQNDSASLDDVPLSQRVNDSKIQSYQDTKLKRAARPEQHEATKVETELANVSELNEKAVEEPKLTTVKAADPMTNDTFPAVKASFEDPCCHGTVAEKPHTMNNTPSINQTQLKDTSASCDKEESPMSVSDSSVGVLDSNSLKKIDPHYVTDQIRAGEVKKENMDEIDGVHSVNTDDLSSNDPSVDVSCTKDVVSPKDVTESANCTINENGWQGDICANKTNDEGEIGLVNVHFKEDGSEPSYNTSTDNVVIVTASSQKSTPCVTYNSEMVDVNNLEKEKKVEVFFTPKCGEVRTTVDTFEVSDRCEKAVDTTFRVDSITYMKSSCGKDGDEKLDSTDNLIATNENCSVVSATISTATAVAITEPCGGTIFCNGGVSRDFGICVEELLKSEDVSDSQLIQTAATCMTPNQANQGKPLFKETPAQPVDCQITTEGCEMIKGLIKELSALNQYVMQAKREVDVLKKQRQMRMKALKAKRK